MTSAAAKLDDSDISVFADELQPGTRLLSGQFTIESFLNAGGFGITYLARDSLDRRVVIKECFPSSFCRRNGTTVAPGTRQRESEFRSVVALFMQEALTLSRLDHPNIVRVNEVFEDNDTAYMAMEYVQGPDLLETVEGKEPALTPEQITRLLGDLLQALSHVHSQGVLHRDISPDNILLERSTGRPVLIDFGAARKDVTRKSRALSGLRVVKDGYSPQEFYIAGSTQSPSSDLYALAASFSHLISREAPKSSQERLSAIANRNGDPQVPLAGRVRGYPPVFLRAIDKAMSIFPRDRLQSVAEWQAMLRESAARMTLTPVADAPVAALSAPASNAPDARQSEAAAPGVRRSVAPVQTRSQTPLPTPPQRRSPSKPMSRTLLRASAAGVLVLAGLLALPDGLVQRLVPVQAPALFVASSADLLTLPGGLAFRMVDTGTRVQTVVAALGNVTDSDLQVGDVLLVYAATGESLGSATSLADILRRDAANDIATYGFAVQRKGNVAVATFRLPGLTEADLQSPQTDVETKT